MLFYGLKSSCPQTSISALAVTEYDHYVISLPACATSSAVNSCHVLVLRDTRTLFYIIWERTL